MSGPDVLCLGELLIDFTPAPGGLFRANPGGAPANVAVQLSRLGLSSAFMGKVGQDAFGQMLKECLDREGVSTAGLVLDPQHPTTLAFVHLDERGERSFSFYRNGGADTQLRPEELRTDLIDGCTALHFGSLSMTDEPSRAATLSAVIAAGERGKLISCDPNWRPLLWPSREEGIRQMRACVSLSDAVKVSEEELMLLTGSEDVPEGIRRLRELGPELVAVTLGAGGCEVSNGKAAIRRPAFPVSAMDTTGCGDSFWGALLSRLLAMGCRHRADLVSLTDSDLMELARFASASGAICATRSGAIPALPDAGEVRAFLSER